MRARYVSLSIVFMLVIATLVTVLPAPSSASHLDPAVPDLWVKSFYGNSVDEAGILGLAETAPAPVGGGSIMIRIQPVPVTDVVLRVRTSDGTAVAGSDYQAVDEVHTVPGTTGFVDQNGYTLLVPVPFIDDSVAEGVEDFVATIEVLSGAVDVVQPSVTIQIVDNDSTTLTFSDVTIIEGGPLDETPVPFAGVTNIPVPNAVYMCLIPSGGTATESVDYFPSLDGDNPCELSPTGTTLGMPIAIAPPNDTISPYRVAGTIVGDYVVEYDETIEWVVGWIWGAQLVGDGTITVTIRDDEDHDSDSDGVDDRIGTGTAGGFSDVALGGTTAGSIDANPSALPILVDDVQPGGVRISIPGSAGFGTVAVSICSPAFTLNLVAGNDVTITCGSITAEVAAGPVEITVPGDGTSKVSIPAGVTAKVVPTGAGAFTVEHLGGTGTVTVTIGGTTTDVAPGAPPAEFSLNEPPSIVAIDAPVGPVNEPVTVAATFTDPDVGDTQTCDFDWGDSQSDSGLAADGLTCRGTHTYAAAGVYTVGVTVTDAAGDADSGESTVVVYDPNGGFVTGGGRINSAAGDYRPDPGVEGKATFGIFSKYRRGATVPTGIVVFRYAAADLTFRTSSYDWLVVTGGDSARLAGTGTIRGQGTYRFMVWAGDGTAADGSDTFRIKIWTEDGSGTETVVYDNGTSDAIARGRIAIHRPWRGRTWWGRPGIWRR